MTKLTAIVVALGVAVSEITFGADCPRPSRAATIPNVKGANYADARLKLLAAGWFPVQTRKSDSDPDVKYGNGPEFWGRGYLELQSCSGTGVAQCVFRWRDKYGNRISIITQGEEIAAQRIHASVVGGRFLCPNED